MTPETLAALAGLLISLAYSYIPGLSDWYSAQSGQYKRLLMLASLAVAALVVFGAACLGIDGTVTCDRSGGILLLRVLMFAVVANQSAFLISPKSTA